MDSNPYVTVGAPNYASPLLDFTKMLAPPGAQQPTPQQNQTRIAGQAAGAATPGLAFQWAQRLRQLFGPQAGGPMQLGAPGLDPGTIGGTAGILPPIV